MRRDHEGEHLDNARTWHMTVTQHMQVVLTTDCSITAAGASVFDTTVVPSGYSTVMWALSGLPLVAIRVSNFCETRRSSAATRSTTVATAVARSVQLGIDLLPGGERRSIPESRG